MAKTDTPRRSTRQRKAVKVEVVTEEPNTEEQTQAACSSEPCIVTEEAGTEPKQEEKSQDEQDSQMDADIEVKGSKPTVAVSWEKTNEGEGDDSEKRSNLSDQLTDQEIMGNEKTPNEGSETKMEQETDTVEDNQETQMDTATEENATTVTESGTGAPEEGQNSSIQQQTGGCEQMVVEEKPVKTKKRKRKVQVKVETSPPKKTKLINDGFCIYAGNLNNLKTFEEVKDSLASYLMTQSLLFQDIRLDRSKKHAHVDLASQMDLTKALTLNGEMILGKPVKIATAKVKSAVKLPENKKAARNARCLFVKNLPLAAKKAHIQKIFPKAVDIRFLGGAEGPSQGIAFLEFKNQSIAKKIQKKMQGAKLKGRVLIVEFVGESKVTKVSKASEAISQKKAAAPPNNTLFVNNLPPHLKEKKLKTLFQNAVSIKLPQNQGKAKGYAFVEFATVEEAEKALTSTNNIKHCKKTIKVQFFEPRANPEKEKVDLKILMVNSLSGKTTADTLQSAFEGALAARVAVDKETGASRRFGFVEFESEEKCKAVKEAMQDCEIDGSKVTMAYAKLQDKKTEKGAQGGGQPAGRRASTGVDLKSLIVKNLSEKTTAETLQSAVEGAVTARIVLDKKTGASRRFGFVEFETEEKCKAVMEAMQDREIDGSKVTVAYAEHQAEKKEKDAKGGVQPPGEEASKVNSKFLVIKKLSEKTTAETLQSAFKEALSARVVLDKKTGASMRFGFVEFESEQKCKAVKEAMQNCEIDGSKVTVVYVKHKGEKKEKGAEGGAKPAAPVGDSDQSTAVDLKSLIVKNLSKKTTAETLQSAVEGAVTARVAVDKKTGASKRFGFVEFESEEKCKAVMEAMQDREIDGSKVTVAYVTQKGAKGAKGGDQPAGRGASRGGRRRGARTPQDTVEKVKNKG